MRTKEFTFKKTKRVKAVTECPAISVDLTVQEAADLFEYLVGAHTPDCRYQSLLEALRDFTVKHGAVSDLVRSSDSGFMMVRR